MCGVEICYGHCLSYLSDEAYGGEAVRMSGMPEEILPKGPSRGTLYDALENLAIPLPDMQQRFPKTNRDARSLSERARGPARYGQVVPSL